MIMLSASRSHAGSVRDTNEDACLDLPDIGVWAVADGMGGHEDGAYASRLIVESLAKVGRHTRLSGLVNEVEDRLLDAHSQLLKRADEQAVVGSTVATLVMMQKYSVCLWAGDTRVYRFRQNQLQQLTHDHSYVEELIETGRLSREEAEKHPEANVITRAVGAGDELFLDATLEDVQPSDLFLICSDGLYKEVCKEEIEKQMSNTDCEKICNSLVDIALERGAQDNVTVVLIAIDGDASSIR
jgi:serine/threonine protein phosphatase PrpC